MGWTLRQWSEAFFRHFFEYNDGDTPVTRLVITDATWSAVTGDASTLPAQIQQAFLNQFPRTRRELNRHLSSQILWRKLPLHDFFPYLILTCLVAAASEETTEAGQFRQRLADMLKTWDFTPLQLTGLGKVWDAFRTHLDEGRHRGQSWRQLILPHPGIETCIGYSKRLAFPSRKDQKELAPLLHILDRGQWLDDEPLIYPVLNIIERHLWKFSAAFREEFRDFKELASSGLGTMTHPFWEVVLSVLRTTPQGNRLASRQTFDVLLLMEFDEFHEPVLALLSKAPSPWSSIVSEPLECAIGGYDRLLVIDEDASGPVRCLLNGELSRSNVRSSLLEVVRDGMLIFQKVDGYPVAQTRPPEPGSAIVLIRRDRKNAFVNALGSLTANRPLKPYAHSDWYWLDDLDSQQIPRLSGIRCLESFARSASIGVYEGIRCQGGNYLGRVKALPEFRLAESALRLNKFSSGSAAAKTPVLYATQTGWRLPEIQAGLDGEFEVVAENRKGIRISARRIWFQRDVLTWDYGSPSDPTAWELEAGRLTPQQDTASLVIDDRPLWDIGGTWEPEQCLQTTTPILAGRFDPGWRRTGLGDLVEALAAIGGTRTLGLAEVEFLDLLRRFLSIGEKEYRLIWDVARAWTEAGLLQRVSDRRWRSVRYLPQIPRLCVSRTVEGAWRGVVVGLIPTAPGDWLDNTAKSWGMEAQWVASISPWLPPGLVLTAATAKALHDFARKQGLEMVIARSLVDCLAPLDQALWSDEPPGNYSAYASWNWEQGRFQKFTDAHPALEGPGVFWHRRERGDRRDYFVARSKNGQIQWSYSRVWSLLAGAHLLDQETYVYSPGEGLVRQALGGIHLPIVVGRLTFALSGCASGPVKNVDGSIAYYYPLFDDAQLEWVGTQLLGWVRRNHEQARVPEWLRALAMAQLPVEPSFLLPVEGNSGSVISPIYLFPLYKKIFYLFEKK